ncbi:SphA family protein [Joostella sp.]|uniref:SphA family protein n=1 Tax=Joostella sp. TaxID=2231138 RepID=UPI003A90A4C8
MRKAIFITFLFFNAILYAQQTASSIQSGSYIPGIMGVRDYTAPEFSGILIFDSNVFLTSNKFLDAKGNEVSQVNIPGVGEIPLNVDISGYLNSLMINYASPELSFLGGMQYLFMVAPVYSSVNVRLFTGQLNNNEYKVDGGASGMGDVTVSPLLLSKAFKNFDLTTGYLFTAPTGRFKTGAEDNVGVGYWSHMFQFAGYYYLNEKQTAFFAMPTYEFHSDIKDTDVRPGSRLILEYGVSHFLNERLELVVQGGHAWQVSRDTGMDVTWDNSVKDRLSTFGVGAGYWFAKNKFYANFKWSTSYANREHFGVNVLQLEFLYIPKVFN